MHIFLVFPISLVHTKELYHSFDEVCIVEEELFFTQYRFHKQKIVFHRATLKQFENWLSSFQKTTYISSFGKPIAISNVIENLNARGVRKITCFDPVDEWLKKRMLKSCQTHGIQIRFLQSPLFINSDEELNFYKTQKQSFFQTDFYIYQRKKRAILVTVDCKPIGGKWSFDAENRKKIPKGLAIPKRNTIDKNEYVLEAKKYVEQYFKTNLGTTDAFVYATNPAEAEEKLNEFFRLYFKQFGEYEDAMMPNESTLFHSILTPYLNTGLLNPGKVIQQACEIAEVEKIPINSLEGFVRQISGWREFIRYVYIQKGNVQRSTAFWKFTRKIPPSFYTGETGILPVDDCIQKVLKSAYNHHIERLMILGNFMLLCEFDPNEVYRWFMEMYIDSYDWVMVPNVYGMSQFADGGLMTTKPYIAGSNYILKMSLYPKGEWCFIWDALFWRFLIKHKEVFEKNMRMRMLIRTYEKFPHDKKQNLQQTAHQFLANLHKQ